MFNTCYKKKNKPSSRDFEFYLGVLQPSIFSQIQVPEKSSVIPITENNNNTLITNKSMSISIAGNFWNISPKSSTILQKTAVRLGLALRNFGKPLMANSTLWIFAQEYLTAVATK